MTGGTSAVGGTGGANDAQGGAGAGGTATDAGCAAGERVFYLDCDGDGYAAGVDSAVTACSAPSPLSGCSGWTELSPSAPSTTDCDDGNAATHPGANEIVADGTDENCDGRELCYIDGDRDGYRTTDHATTLSTDINCMTGGSAPAGEPDTDCDDTDQAIHPGATEICNGVDDNCSGSADEPFACVFNSGQSCTQCGYTGSQLCGSSCTWGACSSFVVNDQVYDTNINTAFTHACGYDCGSGTGDWCSVGATTDCDFISGGPNLTLPPGHYEADFYFGDVGTYDFYVYVSGTLAGSVTGYTNSSSTNFPHVIVPFSVGGDCATVSVRLVTRAGARMRLYTVTIRRTGN